MGRSILALKYFNVAWSILDLPNIRISVKSKPIVEIVATTVEKLDIFYTLLEKNSFQNYW